MTTPIVHYWDGYGCLCMTADGRKANAQCSPEPQKVTCEKCRENLKKIGKLTG